jgi:hypothetical protein
MGAQVRGRGKGDRRTVGDWKPSVLLLDFDFVALGRSTCVHGLLVVGGLDWLHSLLVGGRGRHISGCLLSEAWWDSMQVAAKGRSGAQEGGRYSPYDALAPGHRPLAPVLAAKPRAAILMWPVPAWFPQHQMSITMLYTVL